VKVITQVKLSIKPNLFLGPSDKNAT
jgi:hypothetical protein